jgi:hypothetical protein
LRIKLILGLLNEVLIQKRNPEAMKKIIVITFLSLGISYLDKGQTIKPTVGINFTDVVSNGDGTANGRTGWQIGASVVFGEKIYIEPGIFYQSKSADFSSSDNLTQPDLKADLKGIRVPLALGYNIIGNSESTASLRLFGGPSAFFVTDSGEGVNKDDINSPAWGVFAGAGLDIWILFVDVSYEWSVTDLQTNFTNIDFGKTNGLFANAGIRIRL